MRKLLANIPVVIEAGQAISCIATKAQPLHILSGRVWVTIEGEPEDHWLSAGDSLMLVTGRRIVIEADCTTSRVELPQPVRRGPIVHLGHGLRALTQRLVGDKTVHG